MMIMIMTMKKENEKVLVRKASTSENFANPFNTYCKKTIAAKSSPLLSEVGTFPLFLH